MTKEEQMYREERQLRAMVDCNLLTTDCVTTATVAKRLGMTPKQLYGRLKERGVLYKSDGMWMLIPKYTGLGLRATATLYTIRCWGRRRYACILCGRRVAWSL